MKDIFQEEVSQNLNEKQYEVVFSDFPVMLVLAGPGSGKTRCLTYRVARLIHDGVIPSRIMLTTFTNKAALEMKERTAKLVGPESEKIWCGTFHALGARFLRHYCRHVGLTSNFTILDSADYQDLLYRVAMNSNLYAALSEQARKHFNKARLSNVISFMRNTNQSADKVIESLYPEYVGLGEMFDLLLEEYSLIKKRLNVCDFDDLLVLWLDLMETNPDVLREIRNRFDHILVDEYQDINNIQSRIIDLISEELNLVVVGDDQQAIYSFRGASVENILSFETRYPHAHVVRLEDNYRSTEEIVAYANNSISNNKKRLPKTIKSVGKRGPQPIWVEFEDARTEAKWIISQISEMIKNGTQPEEIAVLYRSSFLASLIEFECLDQGISYQMYGGLKILERSHIKDVMAWMRLLFNPKDEMAWRRVLLLQDGIGSKTFEEVWNQMKDHDDPVLAILIDEIRPSRTTEGWNHLKRVLGDLMSCGLNPDRMIRAVVTDAYKSYLVNRYDDAEERLEDIQRLARYAEEFEHVATFMEHLALDEAITLQEEKGIVLSTIHSAKGKEYEVVFVVGCNERYLPASKSMEKELEEERRLFYVACTRAKIYLVLTSYTYPSRKQKYGELQPSRFLREVDRSLYQYLRWR